MVEIFEPKFWIWSLELFAIWNHAAYPAFFSMRLITGILILSWVIGSHATAPSVSPSLSPTSYVSNYNFMFQVAGSSTSATTNTVGGRATSCNLVGPKGIWQDSTGMMYIVDTDGDCVVSFDVDGDTILRTFAGTCGIGGNTGTGGMATSATFNGPTGIKGDTVGNVVIVDFNNVIIKKVSSSGIVSKFAGTGATSAPIYGGPASSCALSGVSDVFIDTLSNTYIASQTLSQISKVDASGIISLYAGMFYSIPYFFIL